jgi:hypothetical protein
MFYHAYTSTVLEASMKRSIYVGLVSGSSTMFLLALAQILQYQMRMTLQLSYSNTLSLLVYLSPMLSGLVGLVVGLMVLPWRRPKSKTFRLIGWIVFILAEAAGIWLFISLCRSALGIPLSWPLFFASLYLPVSATIVYFGLCLARYADIKMSDEKAAKVIKPLSVVLYILFFIVVIAVVLII